jgi:hypothetical protein
VSSLSLSVARARAQMVLVPFVALPAILLLTALLYLASLNDWFVLHDYIHIKGITSTSVGDYAKRVLDPTDGGESLFDTGELYRPVYYLALLAEHKAFGLEPFGYHLVNLSLHLLNVLLVWLIASKLARSRIVPAVAALIYGIHPAYIDAPAWISAITEVLLATFSLAAIYLFIRSLEERGVLSGLFYLGSFISVVLALGTREPGAALFLILPAYYFLAYRPADWRQPSAWARFIPFFAVLAAWALMRLSVAGAVASGEGASGVGKIGWHMFVNMFKFNGWAVVPVFSQVGPWVPAVEGIAAIALLRLSEQVLRRGSGGARFAVAWWYLALIPYSTQATWLLAGRYMYFGMAAFAILCGMFVAWLAEASWVPALPRLPRLPWPTLARAGAAAAVLVSAVILSWAMLHRQSTFSEYGEESQAFLNQLQETYTDLPEGSTLYVVDPPGSLLFAGDGLFLRPAVGLYYPGVTVSNLGHDQLSEVADSFGDQDYVFTYEGPPDE